MTKRVKYVSLQNILLALLCIVSLAVSGRYVSFAFAYSAPQYTRVLIDLQKDSEFNISEYPDNAQDYSIQFIQIAESVNGELFVYTYQPSQKTTYLVATEINMSLSESVDGTNLYGLTFLNSDGVFCKYKVNDFTVSDEVVRYYNITSIYREWIKGIDDETGNDNIKNAVAFNVGKLFRANTENGKVSYLCEQIETVQIINPFVDFLEYRNGFYLDGLCFDPQWCDSHYIAFSTAKQIDLLVEADVTYIKRYCARTQSLAGYTDYSEFITEYTTLTGDQTGDSFGDGFFAKKYEWKRIQSVEQFIKTEKLTDGTKKNLSGVQWVLRFVETRRSVKEDILSTHSTLYWTEISSVTILRLKFVTNGKVYNLGAISDRVSGDLKPGNTNTDELENFWEWIERITGVPQWVWKLIAAIIPFMILLPILSAIFPVFGSILSFVFGALLKGVVWLFKGLWWLICLPFKGIAALIRKVKDKKDGG